MAFGLFNGLLTGLSGMAQSVINQHYQQQSNAENIALQKEINTQQLNFAKNAYTYATADRLRSGLSPVDTQAAATPTLTSPNVSAPKSAIGDAISNAVSVYNSQRLNESQISANNAVGMDKIADVAEKIAKLDEYLALRESRRAALVADYKNTQDKGSGEAEQLRKQIKIMDESIKKLRAETDNLHTQTATGLHNLNWYSSVGAPVNYPWNAVSYGVYAGKNLSDSSKNEEEEKLRKIEEERYRKYNDKVMRERYAEYVRQYEEQKRVFDQKVYKKELSVKQARSMLGKRLSYHAWILENGL